MDPHYSIVIELETTERVEIASTLFDRELTATRDRVHNHIKRHNHSDWRYSELWVDSITNMGSIGDDVNGNEDLVVSEYMGHGTIRLFKINDVGNVNDQPKTTITIPGDDTMVSMLFVPTYFTVHELLHFYIGDDIVNNQISNFRILKNKENELGFNFMVLIKFRDSLQAKSFREEFNGKRFSKVDPETCHVVPIKEVVFQKALFQTSNTNDKLPYLLTDPFTTTATIGAPLGQIELPTCPVCLEKMDGDVTGLITIPCQHTFHCQCLDKWKNSRCPVCRYSSLRLSRDSIRRQSNESNSCSSCDEHENLWICLICGNIGCGRYNSKHAIQHYEETSHCFAMDMRTQRVWDYSGDNYVHRLVQNEADGKLVEVGSSRSGSNSTNNKDGNQVENFVRNKEYHLEYEQVLISQLESQREYYEMRLQHAQESSANQADFQELRDQMEELRIGIRDTQKNTIKREQELKKELQMEKLVVTGLQENLDYMNKKHEKLELENNKSKEDNEELNSQVKDLMFYLESQEKFKDADESVKEGTIVIQQQDVPSKKKKKNKKKLKN